ncbi:MAG: S-methyl-5'-thioadenosine phosphorylase [Polyangiaceae bacterium]
MSKRTLGVIGGSGLYAVPGAEVRATHAVETAFGAPSDEIIEAELGDTKLLFLPRHGRDHRFAPHEVNYRANILALKMLGAEQILSFSAVGSLKEELPPGTFVTVDQYIDRTRTRAGTFFQGFGVVAHVGLAHPVDEALRLALFDAARRAGASVVDRGAYVCIEGPQFSTLAESLTHQRDGASVIGMTNMPEARLAREAELPYAALAMVTDYDCWHPSEATVDVATVVATMKKNGALALETLRALAPALPDPASSPASRALDGAIMTRFESISHEAKRALAPLIEKYVR